MRIFLILFTIFFAQNSFAALPFVTDDAGIASPKQLILETFVERWSLPAKAEADKGASRLYGPYLSFSYGLSRRLEFSFANMVSYNVIDKSTSFMNPIFQLKTKIFESKNPATPMIAIDWGYVNKNGSGEYFDPATNFYAIAALTSRFLDDNLMVHVNVGKKASYDILANHLIRTHLGVAFDMAVFHKDIRLVLESYNGAPNSPRDSPTYFRSRQIGAKWLKSDAQSFYIIYGEQPTFTEYDSTGHSLYRNTNWVQVGMRLALMPFENF